MATIELLGTGRIDERESAFPQATQLANGDILCSYSVGGGANVSGGTDWSRSTDGGRSWVCQGTILPHDAEGGWANFLKLSRSRQGVIFAYGGRIADRIDRQFGQRPTTAILCQSTDDGRTWSDARPVPMPLDCPLEVSHGVLVTTSGRLLAPAAPLAAPDRLAERVWVAVSDDGGTSWSRHATVFCDPEGKRGYFEHKLAEFAPGQLIATAWTVRLGDYSDFPDSFAISRDNGLTWSEPRSTGIQGQTMTPVSLGEDRLLVLYNRRYGAQGIVACLVTFTNEAWTVHHEQVIYDARARHERSADFKSGIDELDTFAFGFPTTLPLHDGDFLVTNWSVENGVCGIRWTRLRVAW